MTLEESRPRVKWSLPYFFHHRCFVELSFLPNLVSPPLLCSLRQHTGMRTACPPITGRGGQLPWTFPLSRDHFHSCKFHYLSQISQKSLHDFPREAGPRGRLFPQRLSVFSLRKPKRFNQAQNRDFLQIFPADLPDLFPQIPLLVRAPAILVVFTPEHAGLA